MQLMIAPPAQPLILLVLVITLFLPDMARSEVPAAAHDLSVELFPAEGRLVGEGRISLQPGEGGRVSVYLNPNLSVRSLTWNGREIVPSVRGWEIRLTLPPEEAGVLAIAYEGVFDDPFEVRPLAMDSPGQGVLGTISEKGALLLAGSGWHPMIPSHDSRYRIRVTAPPVMHAVTLGRLVSFAVDERRAVTEWEVDHPAEGLPLTAGPYELRTVQEGEIPVQTFFFPETAELAPVYLGSSAEHLRFYSELHGPYAFPKWAVVENFFPTGYGFPSFTLLGSAVLRLPFIPETSLRHEVAHCWWGNGVLVDYSRGNWSEGLTTYVADYLSQEIESEDEAREYRAQVLRDYAVLARGEDFPISRFVSRTDPASRAVGYGKGMFLFHMARQMAGEERFWEGLREVYRTKLFQRASWTDFAAAFVHESPWEKGEAARFWEQWVERSGGPILSVELIDVAPAPEGWRVRAVLRQAGEPYLLRLPVVLETEGGRLESTLDVRTAEHQFELLPKSRPTRLMIDPEYHVFRLLSAGEIPATVNSVRGSESLAAVIGQGWEGMEPVLRALLVSLNQPEAHVVRERDVRAEDLRGKDILVFGFPEGKTGVPLPPDRLRLRDAERALDRVAGARSLFLATEHPDDPSRTAAFFLPAETADRETLHEAVRRITHYGKYSILVFHGSRVVERFVSEPSEMPLAVDLASRDRGGVR
jgi:hypothetical protein